MPKYFIIGASKDHVLNCVKGSFAQAGHGRKDLLTKLSKGDWIVFYSSKSEFEGKELLQQFTAIGEVRDKEPYQAEVNDDFKPFRRNMDFKKSTEAAIRPLLPNLTFIKNKKRWGFYLMSGFVEIEEQDFMAIKEAMLQQ